MAAYDWVYIPKHSKQPQLVPILTHLRLTSTLNWSINKKQDARHVPDFASSLWGRDVNTLASRCKVLRSVVPNYNRNSYSSSTLPNLASSLCGDNFIIAYRGKLLNHLSDLNSISSYHQLVINYDCFRNTEETLPPTPLINHNEW